MDCLMDNLNPDKWTETKTDERGDGFIEYAINRNHKHTEPSVMTFLISDMDGNGKTVQLHGTLDNKDPIKSVGRAEIKLDAEGKTVLGIDVEGDCVVIKS